MKNTEIITRVNSLISRIHPIYIYFQIFDEDSHYRCGQFQENRIQGEFAENLGIHPIYHFCDFSQK